MKSLTTQDLAAIRRVILTVIDEGDVKRGIIAWDFHDIDEEYANMLRLDFCDRVQELLVKEAGIEATGSET